MMSLPQLLNSAGTIVRENVCNTAKKRKKSRFWILKKKRKSKSFRDHSISFFLRPYFNQQFYIMLYV